jgi:hypothetical protein
VVEGASLENWNTGNRIEGSNPSLSASMLEPKVYGAFRCVLRDLVFRPFCFISVDEVFKWAGIHPASSYPKYGSVEKPCRTHLTQFA